MDDQLILRRQKKEKIFRSGFTAEARSLIFVNGIIATAFLIIYFLLMGTIPPVATAFFAVGLLLAVYTATLVHGCIGKKVTVTPTYISFERGNNCLTIMWKNLKKFSPPVEGRMRFRKAILGDGDHSFSLDSLSFEEFDLLVSVITVARKTKYTPDAPYE
jgi:hypothetical protein